MRVRSDLVLVQPAAQQEVGDTVKLVTNETPDYLQGCVLGVGPRVTDLFVGDVILFSKYAGVEVPVDGRPHRVIRDYDVLVVMTSARPTITDGNPNPADSVSVTCSPGGCCGA